MKVKDLERTANVAWSPASQATINLAAGTAAQQLDASFNTNATLEVYGLNIIEPGMDMELKASSPSDHRFHKIVWGACGGGENSLGTIVGGCDDGIIQIYDVSKLMKGENGLVSKQNKHSKPVHSLDFNPFQTNLLATGASDSEIFIWDINNTSNPMTPGAKSQPYEDVLSISWNRQVQHILASTFSSKCVVWDLRKNEPIIKLSDTVSRIRWKVVAWHPEVATQLCLASEEDQAPVIQLWDLRFATSPLRTLENHQRGVLSIDWCAQDSDLLISCGKDNRILCWNPNSDNPGGEVLSEVAKTNQWNFDISWCPKNPALIASPCFDGHVSVYSLMGGKTQQIVTSNKIADSFPGMDGYLQAPVQQQMSAPVSVDLSKPPKWLKKPAGASFGFGGKLVTFTHDKDAIAKMQQNLQPCQVPPRVVRSTTIHQVVTENDLVNESAALEQALQYGNFSDYCKNKADTTDDQHKRYIWHFLKAHFEQSPRAELLNLLGYKIEDVNTRLNDIVGIKNTSVDQITDGINNISDLNDADPFSGIGQNDIEPKKVTAPYRIKTGEDSDGLITQAILMGNVEAAVELCMKAKRFADAIIIAMTGGENLLAKTQFKYFQQSEGYVSSLISALVSEDWVSVINSCDVTSWKEALTAVLTHASNEDLPALCEAMGDRLTKESHGNIKLQQDAQLCYICAGSFDKLVSSWSENATKSTADLQELVELVTFLQKAVERQGRSVEITGRLAELLSRYASLLASQGSLATALNYLGTSADEQVTTLRDRLYVTLGHKAAYRNMQQTARTRQTSARDSISSYSNQFSPAAPAYNQPSYNFNTGLPNVQANQPWNTQNAMNPLQPPKPFSPAPPSVPPTQPPRPSSASSNQGGSGLPKAKYLLDPSVTNNSYGARNNYAPNAMLPPMPNQTNFQTNAISSQPMNQFNPQPLNPIPMNPMQPTPMMPSQNPTRLIPSMPVQNQPTFANSPYTGDNLSEVGQSAMNFLPPNAAPGWNDPPAVSKPVRPPPKVADAPPAEPITHPIFGSAPVQQYPNNNGYMDPNQNMPFNPNFGQQNTAPPPQMFQPPPPSNGGFNQSMNFNTNPVNQGNFNQTLANEYNAPTQMPEKPAPVQKAPIPEEHLHMKTVLDELCEKCSCTANNPQIKRKIDDVARKLESLYDLLREHKLSPNTLSALHQIVQLIQVGDYAGGLNIHTQLVSGPDFAQIASFMPGVKVLLQCSLQLQVYIR